MLSIAQYDNQWYTDLYNWMYYNEQDIAWESLERVKTGSLGGKICLAAFRALKKVAAERAEAMTKCAELEKRLSVAESRIEELRDPTVAWPEWWLSKGW